MPERHVPVHPDLEQLRHQAKDFLKAIRQGEPAALGELERNHPGRPAPTTARLADAQLAGGDGLDRGPRRPEHGAGRGTPLRTSPRGGPRWEGSLFFWGGLLPRTVRGAGEVGS